MLPDWETQAVKPSRVPKGTSEQPLVLVLLLNSCIFRCSCYFMLQQFCRCLSSASQPAVCWCLLMFYNFYSCLKSSGTERALSASSTLLQLAGCESGVQAPGSTQVSSLCCHCCPLCAHPASLLSYLCSHHTALCLTLAAQRVAWSASKFPLYTDFRSWIF